MGIITNMVSFETILIIDIIINFIVAVIVSYKIGYKHGEKANGFRN